MDRVGYQQRLGLPPEPNSHTTAPLALEIINNARAALEIVLTRFETPGCKRHCRTVQAERTRECVERCKYGSGGDRHRVDDVHS